eukprot:502527_1
MKVTELESSWFEKTKLCFNELMSWIDERWEKVVGKKLAVITKVSVHGLYYGMKKLAEEILSAGEGFYFCPFKFGEAICELLFSKLRSMNKATAGDYATGIALLNSSAHRKRQKRKIEK